MCPRFLWVYIFEWEVLKLHFEQIGKLLKLKILGSREMGAVWTGNNLVPCGYNGFSHHKISGTLTKMLHIFAFS